MSILSQPHPETEAAIVTEGTITTNMVDAAVSENLEQRLNEMREAAQLMVDARGTVAKEAALKRLESSLVITAPLPDAAKSTVVATDASITTQQTTTITVTLLDVAENPVPNRPVTLAGTNHAVVSGGGSTNSSGEVTFTVGSGTSETCVFTATASGDAIVVTETAEVVISAP